MDDNTARQLMKSQYFTIFLLATTALAGFYSLVLIHPSASQEVPLLVVGLPVTAFVAWIVAIKNFDCGELYAAWRISTLSTIVLFIGFVGFLATFGIKDGSPVGSNLLLTAFVALVETAITITTLTTIPVIIRKFNQWRSGTVSNVR